MKDKNEIKLGDKVVDRISGFEGVATSQVNHLTGQTGWWVTPEVKDDGSRIDEEYFDDGQLHVEEAGVGLLR